MIGTMHTYHSLPKSYGSSYGRGGKSSGGAVTTIALVVLAILSAGLSFGYISAKSQMRDISIQHEGIAEELTYTKNHLHHVEAQLASREIDYQHLAAELNEQHGKSQTPPEVDTLRQQKRQVDESLAASNDQISRLKQELEATNALIEAYKQHLSDEVASHHQREENWLHIQEDWDRLEKEMEDEINTLRAQLQIAKLTIPASVHEHHNIPQHMIPEPVKHDPIYDHLPPPHIPTHDAAHDIHSQPQHVATPVPVHQVAASPAPIQQPIQVQPSPASVVPAQHAQQVTVQPNGTPVQQVNSPVPIHQQQQQQGTGVPVPPQPPASPHYHHDPHYEFHHENHDHETNDWHPNWQQEEYAQYFEHNNHYADYPGWVDDKPAQHHEAQNQQQQDAHGQQQHDPHAQQHHDVHGQQQYDSHGQQPQGQQQYDPHGQQHHNLHQQQQQQQQEVAHAGDWHHHDDSHHLQHDSIHAQQQQQQHVNGHQAPTGTWQQQHPDAHQEYQQHHHGSDDLSMKLGIGHRRR